MHVEIKNKRVCSKRAKDQPRYYIFWDYGFFKIRPKGRVGFHAYGNINIEYTQRGCQIYIWR